MPIMLWDESLDIGVEAMNSEHRDILDLMNRIFDASAAGQLGDVCTRHFAEEEAYMRNVQFPGIDAHCRLHQKLLGRYTEYAAEIKARGGETDPGFFNFLKFWLSSHIKGIDVKYAEHAIQRPAA